MMGAVIGLTGRWIGAVQRVVGGFGLRIGLRDAERV